MVERLYLEIESRTVEPVMAIKKRAKRRRKVEKTAIREAAAESNRKQDSLVALCGSGKHIWADESADAYVARLREGWD